MARPDWLVTGLVCLFLMAQNICAAQNGPAFSRIQQVFQQHGYVVFDLGPASLTKGEAIYVVLPSGSLKQFRVEKVQGGSASAIPIDDLSNVAVGQPLYLAAQVGAPGTAGTYARDRPLATSQEVARAMSDANAQAQAQARADFNALLGGLVGVAAGAAKQSALPPQARNPGQVQTMGMMGAAAASGDQEALALLQRLTGVNPISPAPSRPVGGTSAEMSAIGGQCNTECGPHRAEAERGSMRASYEAGACTCACFYRFVPRDDPNRAQMKQCAIENSQKARALGSTVPIVVSD